MPGNETVERSSKSFVPWIWKELNVVAGEVDSQVAVAGFPPGITRFAPARDTSVVSLTVQLSAPLTVGWLDFELTKGGSKTGKKVRMNAAVGTVNRLLIVPGALTGGPGDRIGIFCSSAAALAPSGSVDAVIFIEVQDS